MCLCRRFCPDKVSITRFKSQDNYHALPMSASGSDSPAARRFSVALSFPGEHRSIVKEVAEHLAATLTQERVLYDKFHEAEFARSISTCTCQRCIARTPN